MNKAELSIKELNKSIAYGYFIEMPFMLQIFYCITSMYSVEDFKNVDEKIMYELYVNIADTILNKKSISEIQKPSFENMDDIANDNSEQLDYICENIILMINKYSEGKKKNRIENIIMFPKSKFKDSIIRMGLIHGDKKVKTKLANYKLKNK